MTKYQLFCVEEGDVLVKDFGYPSLFEAKFTKEDEKKVMDHVLDKHFSEYSQEMTQMRMLTEMEQYDADDAFLDSWLRNCCESEKEPDAERRTE